MTYLAYFITFNIKICEKFQSLLDLNDIEISFIVLLFTDIDCILVFIFFIMGNYFLNKIEKLFFITLKHIQRYYTFINFSPPSQKNKYLNHL